MAGQEHHHQLLATHATHRGNQINRRSTQSKIKRKNGRLTSRSSTYTNSTRPGLRAGTTTTTLLDYDRPGIGRKTQAYSLSDTLPSSEPSLGGSDAAYDWDQTPSSEFDMVERSPHPALAAQMDKGLPPAAKRIRVCALLLLINYD